MGKRIDKHLEKLTHLNSKYQTLIIKIKTVKNINPDIVQFVQDGINRLNAEIIIGTRVVDKIIGNTHNIEKLEMKPSNLWTGSAYEHAILKLCLYYLMNYGQNLKQINVY